MKQYFLFLFLAPLCIISCNNNKAGNFWVKAPVGWVKKDTLSKSLRKQVNMHPVVLNDTPGFMENIRISIMRSGDPESYMHAVVNLIKKDAPYFEDKGGGIYKATAFKAYWEQHVIVNSRDEKIEQKTFYIGDHGNVYMIICSAKKGDMERMQGSIDQVLGSFKIL